MKHQILKVFLVLMLGLTACTVNPPDPQVTTETAPSPGAPATAEILSITTPMGEFVIASARFVDEVNGIKPGPGEKLLLIELTKPGMESLDPGDFSLEEFQTMVQDSSQGMIHILGDDGSETISTMAGWVGPEYKEFAMGFRLPRAVTSYQFVWPGNDPLTIIPEE